MRIAKSILASLLWKIQSDFSVEIKTFHFPGEFMNLLLLRLKREGLYLLIPAFLFIITNKKREKKYNIRRCFAIWRLVNSNFEKHLTLQNRTMKLDLFIMR